MTKKIIVLVLLVVLVAQVHGQVTIGSALKPHEKALLDLKENEDGTSSKGLILPRVALKSVKDFFGSNQHERGTTVYNTNTTSVTDDSVAPEDRVSTGFYYNNGVRWEKLSLGYTNWFYMPSIPINVGQSATRQTLNLYDKYKTQFSGQSGNFVKSAGAPAVIPYFPEAKDLYYYITDFDPTVFSNITITEDGKMTYDVAAAATEYTFINIIFVLK